MKTNVPILALLILVACNTAENRDGRIKKAIWNQVTKGLDKNKLQQVDSVQLTRVDSMTEKAYIYQLILDKQKLKEIIAFSRKSDSELITELQRSIALAKIYHTKTNWQDTEIARISKDITQNDSYLKVYTHQLDSLEKLEARADGRTFKYFYTESRIFYSINHVKDTIEATSLVKSDFTISDTTNPILTYQDIKNTP